MDRYWREFDLVRVSYSMRMGILDYTFHWPEKHYRPPEPSRVNKVMLYPARWRPCGHMLFYATRVKYFGSYIIENLTFKKKVIRIQQAWRKHMLRRTQAAMTIQRMFRICIADPNYTMCRSRLDHELLSLPPIMHPELKTHSQSSG